MSRYLEILAVQRPFPIGVDENGRTMFSVNFDALAAAPVAKWEEELQKVLADAGLSNEGVDTFYGPASVVPDGSGPFITIIDTGGTAPEETHNGSVYERLSVQIMVRATGYTDARTRALAIWRELNGIRNTTIAA